MWGIVLFQVRCARGSEIVQTFGLVAGCVPHKMHLTIPGTHQTKRPRACTPLGPQAQRI
jgi:hypothetical protein